MLSSLIFIVYFLHSSSQQQTTNQISPKVYLEKFGYLKAQNNSNISEITNTSSLSNALRKFQEFYNLEETGEVNNETLNLMQKPRCGVADFPSNYALANTKWTKKHLGWKFVKGNFDDEYIESEAFKL